MISRDDVWNIIMMVLFCRKKKRKKTVERKSWTKKGKNPRQKKKRISSTCCWKEKPTGRALALEESCLWRSFSWERKGNQKKNRELPLAAWQRENKGRVRREKQTDRNRSTAPGRREGARRKWFKGTDRALKHSPLSV